MGYEDSGSPGDKLEDLAGSGSVSSTASSDGERLMTLRDLLAEIKAGRRTFLFSALAVFAVTVIVLFMAPTKFEAFVTVAPPEDRSPVSSASDSVLSSIGLSLGTAGEFSPFDHFVETVTSVKLAERLERDEQLSRRIFAYDAEAQEFVRPKSPMALLNGFVNWVFGQPGWTPPENHDLAKYFKRAFELEQDRDTGVVTIRYQHGNRAFAEEILSKVINKADTILREEEMAINQARHAYLEERLRKEVRQTNRALVAELLLDAEQRLMLASVDPMFGARVIDGPTSSSKPVSPKVLLTLIIGVVLAFMVGVAVIFVKILLRRQPD